MIARLHSLTPTWKVPILLHKQAKWRLIVKVAVDIRLEILLFKNFPFICLSFLFRCYNNSAWDAKSHAEQPHFPLQPQVLRQRHGQLRGHQPETICHAGRKSIYCGIIIILSGLLVTLQSFMNKVWVRKNRTRTKIGQ